jgi:phosphoribosylaminoimidazole-succinocarboxamide synthase
MITLPGLTPAHRGKVRDVYDLGETLVIVASDRISAFDVVFDEPIPEKGKILSQISAWWFLEHPDVGSIADHHVLETDPARFPAPFAQYADLLAGRSMLVRKAARVDFECVVRGYLSGSAWKEYREAGTVNGEAVPRGLVESDRFPEPFFTPATKAETGHDENIPFAQMEAALEPGLASVLRALSLKLYAAGASHAESRGLILADTKFEFGLLEDGSIILIDEILTPDSSRYWFRDDYLPGRAQNPFDKQFLRDYLETLDWNKEPPPPALPEHVIHGTLERYREAFQLITGRSFVS